MGSIPVRVTKKKIPRYVRTGVFLLHLPKFFEEMLKLQNNLCVFYYIVNHCNCIVKNKIYMRFWQ